MKKLYLVDVSSMFFRAFYAIRPLSNQSGMPTNAIYGFVSMTIKLLREIKPDYLAFCFDRPEPSFRKELDERYKANRTEMPEELKPQVPYIRKVSEAFGIACFDKLSFEADDIIGTLAKWGHENGCEVDIVSGDKDFGQLVKPNVFIYDTMKEIRYDVAGVVEKWGIEPRKFIDYLAIVGDSSDNVPGVKGIGPKGACKLLSEYDSLEDIYKNIDKIKPDGIRNKLIENKDEAFLSKKLVTIHCDVPIEFKAEDLRLKPIHREELHSLLMELDFKSFAKNLLGDNIGAPKTGDVPKAEEAPKPTTVSDMVGSKWTGSAADFVRPATPSAPPPQPEVSRVFDIPKVEERRMNIEQVNRWLTPGSETWGIHTERGVMLAHDGVVAEVEGSWEDLGNLLSEKNLKWKGFDVKEFWKTIGLKAPVSLKNGDPVVWDQMLAAYVARAGAIDDVRNLFTLYNGVPLPELPSPGQLYAAHQMLETNLRRKLATVNGEKVLAEIELPLVPVLYDMERAGIRVDVSALEKQSVGLTKEIAAFEKEIHALAGETFNIGSPKQLGQILFDKLKMPAGRKTKTGYSTDEDTLAKLANEFPIAGKVLQYRELTKLKSTYVDALPASVNKATGRIHTTFHQANTATGRLASINPNLQNIPIRTERGTLIRRAFIAGEGLELISADYSQIELRILAHITSDAGLTKAFQSGIDIHTATASEVFGVKVNDVTSEMRRKAKAVNFGLAYGQGVFGLAEALRIPRGEATEIIARYFERFSGVRDYMEQTVEVAKKQGYVETIFGRRRYIDELFSKAPAVKKFGERAAINAPIQGAASDIVKKAMIDAYKKVSAQMLLQVHDELIFEAPKEHVEEIAPVAKSVMESAVKLSVPLDVNVGHGANWDSAHS